MLTSRFYIRAQRQEARVPGYARKPRHGFYLLGLLASLALTGCAMSDVPHSPGAPRALLQPWIDLTGAQTGASPAGPISAGYVTLRRPTAMSARDNESYLADAGLNRIFRYNRAQQTLIPFTNLPVTEGMSIHAAPDRTVYITEPTRKEVLHFSWDGTQLPSFVSPGNLARPVSVAVEEGSGRVLVADALFDQFIVFDSLGMTLSVIKPQQTVAIAAMATGPDGIYVLDRLAKRVVVLGRDGSFRYALGDKELGEPVAIAVNRDNLVFVSDKFDQTVKVYRGRKAEDGSSALAAKVGGPGASAGKFNGIGGLAVDGGLLYVTDSQNARVQILLVNQ